MNAFTRHPASFKDPSGFIFFHEEVLYRQVNQLYAAHYDQLVQSGLYQLLTNKSYLIPHREIDENFTGSTDWYRTLQPELIPFISYPYEWCFDQLKDAALLTLSVQRSAIDHGMILKDATPLNIQFRKGKPVFIDTLSFELYDPSMPWIAYRQFCECFLFPLYLEFYLKIDVQKIMSTYLDGIPVEITSKMLPIKSGFNLGVWLHVHLQNNVRTTDGPGRDQQGKFDKKKMLNLISHLESIIHRFTSPKTSTSAWSNYYEKTILGKQYLQTKEALFLEFTGDMESVSVLDIGGNDGHFSKLLADRNCDVVTIDTDSQSISNLYQHIKKSNVPNILPLTIDISNPSPAFGFDHRERMSFEKRFQTELVLALALIHHLALTKNLPLQVIASYFHSIAPILIIEFVPKTDEKVKEMLAGRKDVFPDYTISNFEEQFSNYFNVLKKQVIAATDRVLYLMKRSAN